MTSSTASSSPQVRWANRPVLKSLGLMLLICEGVLLAAFCLHVLTRPQEAPDSASGAWSVRAVIFGGGALMLMAAVAVIVLSKRRERDVNALRSAAARLGAGDLGYRLA